MSERLQKQLVDDALRMAIGRRDLRGELVHNSDQGSQYTSHDFLALLQQYDIQVSMSGVGNCYDNAMMESFFSYSQIWVMESTNQMAVGGKSNRAVLFFQEEFRRIVNAVKNY